MNSNFRTLDPHTIIDEIVDVFRTIEAARDKNFLCYNCNDLINYANCYMHINPDAGECKKQTVYYYTIRKEILARPFEERGKTFTQFMQFVVPYLKKLITLRVAYYSYLTQIKDLTEIYLELPETLDEYVNGKRKVTSLIFMGSQKLLN